jgi:CheY-like chemotaxis protein
MQMFGDITVVEAPTAPEDIIQAAQQAPHRPTPKTSFETISHQHGARNCRILVADDTPTSRLIIREMLEEAGYEVETVENGEQLARRVQFDIDNTSDTPISLVLTDIEMPIMSGLEATQKIRALEAARPERPRLPIIAITAHALMEEQRRFREGGIDYVVTKPLKPTDLNEALIKMTTHNAISAPNANTPLEPRTLSAVLLELTTRLWDEMSLAKISSTPALPKQGIDIEDVFERSGESPRRTKLILNAFLGAYQDPLLILRKVGDPTDIKEITVAAHALKGLLLDVGANHTAERAACVERLLKAGDYE